MANHFAHNADYKVIERLVRSATGMMLAVRATNMDYPALCGVDVLLRMELGTDYARANRGTRYAGYTVAELMREMGYVQAGTGKCCLDCIAGEGIIWKTKSAHETTGTESGASANPQSGDQSLPSIAGLPHNATAHCARRLSSCLFGRTARAWRVRIGRAEVAAGVIRGALPAWRHAMLRRPARAAPAARYVRQPGVR